MFRFTHIYAITLWLGVVNPVYAVLDDPAQTVEVFYRHIKNRECAEAVILADGYSIDKCKNVSRLEIGPISGVVNASTKAFVNLHVDYQQISPIKNVSCDVTIPLNRKNESWVIDFPSRKFNCANSNVKVDDKGGQQIPSANKTSPLDSQPKPQSNPNLPPQSVPQPPLPPPYRPAIADTKPKTLLDTWTADELRGHPGDERIVKLHPPDLTPPQRLQPSQKLPQLNALRVNSIRRVRLADGKKIVALTFDLCEQAHRRTGYDRGIVNTLRDQGVPATFFAGGKWMRSHQEKTLQLMADSNFEIGNHAWTHGNLRVLKGQKMLDQIIWTQAEYERIWETLKRRAEDKGLGRKMETIPRQPHNFRFPYGTCNAESLRAVNEMGLNAIQWDVVSGDAATTATPDKLVHNILNNVRPGSIIVFHANGHGHGTAAALPRIISGLKEKGYRFMTVGKLLEEGTPESVQECYELKPGDNRHYDDLFGEGTQ